MKFRTIKKLGILYLVFFSIAGKAQTTASVKDTIRLTLDKAIEIALSENPSIKVADLEIEKKMYAKKSTQSSLYPQLDAIGQYTRTLKKQVMYLDGAFGGVSMFTPMITGMENTLTSNVPGYTPGSLSNDIATEYAKIPDTSGDGIEVGRDNNWMGGFNLAWPVIIPTLWKSLDISSLDLELAVEKARSSKIDMTSAVRKAFYNVLLAQDSYHVFQEGYDNALMNYNDINNKFKQGMASEFDLVRADVRVKNVKPNMIQSENAWSMATLTLKALMGIDMDRAIAASGSLKDYEEKLYADILKVDTTLINNSTLKQFDLQNDQLKKTVELYKAQYLPVVSISGNYMYMSMNNGFKLGDYKWNPTSTIGLTVSIPIFDGFRKRSDIKQAQVSVKQMEWQREDVVRNLKLGVNNSINSMTNSVEQILSTKDAQAQAQKGYEIAQKRYDTGMGTVLEINDAQLGYIQASLAFNQAIYNYLAAKADLDQILGKELEK